MPVVPFLGIQFCINLAYHFTFHHYMSMIKYNLQISEFQSETKYRESCQESQSQLSQRRTYSIATSSALCCMSNKQCFPPLLPFPHTALVEPLGKIWLTQPTIQDKRQQLLRQPGHHFLLEHSCSSCLRSPSLTSLLCSWLLVPLYPFAPSTEQSPGSATNPGRELHHNSLLTIYFEVAVFL